MENSLSLFVGTRKCNAHCGHCAGKVHRRHAPTKDGIVDEELVIKTLRDCYVSGARRLTISSSGEPTLSPISVTKVFQIIDNMRRKEGVVYSPISLYSNGIRIGEDQCFSEEYLPLWKALGLTKVYITIHDINEHENAKIYRIAEYPKLVTIIERIHDADLLMRANLVLSRNTTCELGKFISIVKHLEDIGADSISAWPIRGIDDEVDKERAPIASEMNKMSEWALQYSRPGFELRVLGEENRIAYQSGQKLTLFPDGSLSGTWCNN
ncbi:radical SAM protein [Patescibacteria group bacterium]